MSVLENTCQCGCSTMTVVTEATDPCACGCACCSDGPTSKDDEIVHLRRLRESVERRLADLEGA